MTPERNDRSFEPKRRGVADRETKAGGEIRSIRGDRSKPLAAAAEGDIRRTGRYDVTQEQVRVHGSRRGGSAARERLRRLGPLEYMLLALIALGIAITITMAILNPSGQPSPSRG